MSVIERAAEKTMGVLADGINKEQLIDDLKVVVADAEAQVKATANQSGEKLTVVRAKAIESLRVAKAKMAEAQEALLAKTKTAAKATDVYVHEKPWEAIGMAAGVGLLIGVLIGRR